MAVGGIAIEDAIDYTPNSETAFSLFQNMSIWFRSLPMLLFSRHRSGWKMDMRSSKLTTIQNFFSADKI
ncbi:hypothetical protein CHS0354_011072 [Potamilus streckersoni]|uniref:Uncharacterized protein n=1 Tax=Potamilus streckersoni TaxID=2493646 RepID=A0AAE0TP26_9BIVA|nr:hypothetical protein CHS0354_011072 [Potamilus streckersoni]